jgi:light-regulated signal transduction histidine kinase (bacteriophytochrome)
LIDDINQILKASEQLSLLINKLLSNNHRRQNDVNGLNRHDLRNHFNHIIGFCEMLLEDFDKKTHPKAHVVLQQILTTALRLLKLIDELSLPSAPLKKPELID